MPVAPGQAQPDVAPEDASQGDAGSQIQPHDEIGRFKKGLDAIDESSLDDPRTFALSQVVDLSEVTQVQLDMPNPE